MSTLVTGGAGYIGSHAVKRLLGGGADVVVVDDFSRGRRGAIARLRAYAERAGSRLTVVEAGISDRAAISRVIGERSVQAVMHFAAFIEVGESVRQPLKYYANNTAGAISLIETCLDAGVERMVFSSTAATYGEPPADRVPIREDCPQRPINPYGSSKLAVESVLRDTASAAGDRFGCAMLRYFNVAGCDPDGLIGEDHRPETHLIPLVLHAAMGKRDAITIFGTDYPTPDGTCLRDYIHVWDLVEAHVRVLETLRPGESRAYNLGIGVPISVRQIIDAAGEVVGRPIPTREGERRPGDPAVLYSDPAKIGRELGWSASYTEVRRIIETAWKWMSANPEGYAD